jgi:hypothetical protein
MAWIRTLLIPAMALALTAHPVCATDIITTFDVTATLSPSPTPCTSPCTLGGTITIDVTNGSVTAADITAPGTVTGPFDLNILTMSPFPILPTATLIQVSDNQNDVLDLVLPVSSLINYGGGPICPGPSACQGPTSGAASVIQDSSGQTAYIANVGGRLSPVPGPIAGAGLPGLILAGGGFLGWWRRRKNA